MTDIAPKQPFRIERPYEHLDLCNIYDIEFIPELLPAIQRLGNLPYVIDVRISKNGAFAHLLTSGLYDKQEVGQEITHRLQSAFDKLEEKNND